MTASTATVPYALDADASHVARAADRALEGTGARVWYVPENASVWVNDRHAPVTEAVLFDVGQQLVVEGGTWRIEDAAVTS